jgi:hypothetical protein
VFENGKYRYLVKLLQLLLNLTLGGSVRALGLLEEEKKQAVNSVLTAGTGTEQYRTYLRSVLRIRDVYPGSRIPDPDFYPSRIPDPGSRISDPGSKNSNKRER